MLGQLVEPVLTSELVDLLPTRLSHVACESTDGESTRIDLSSISSVKIDRIEGGDERSGGSYGRTSLHSGLLRIVVMP